jgi:teichuronic acid biosynthesis glycosyltransferase TuaG
MLVSIITPAHNASAWISETIESVIQQTYWDWEMIIADDCSTDSTREVIQAFIDRGYNIKLLPLKDPHGAARTRNAALHSARGRFIAFLDADDLWLPEKLETQVNFMQTNGYAFTYTAYEAFYDKIPDKRKTINVPPSITHRRYLRNTIIGCLTVMIDRSLTGHVEMPDIRSSHDMALWLQLLKHQPAYGIQKVLARYRILPDSNTSRKWKAATDVWTVYRRIEKLGFCSAIFNFAGYLFNAVWKRI